MTKVDVKPGICGFATIVTCKVDETYQATVIIESECANVAKLSEEIASVSVLDELRVPINETAVYRAAAACRLHAACPVPSAILKAIEVSAGLALPADVHMAIETLDR